jgi:hypothetical protein
LSGADLEADESHHGGADSHGTKNKRKSDALGVMENTLEEQDERESVD